MTDEEKRAEAAKKKREYRQRKKAEELAHQAPKEELTSLFNAQARNLKPEELDALATAQMGITAVEKERMANLNEEFEREFQKEKQWASIHPYYPPGVIYKDNHKDELADMLAASEERRRRVELIMSVYQRDAANTNALLWHLIENLILMRLELTDMIGGLHNGK